MGETVEFVQTVEFVPRSIGDDSYGKLSTSNETSGFNSYRIGLLSPKETNLGISEGVEGGGEEEERQTQLVEEREGGEHLRGCQGVPQHAAKSRSKRRGRNGRAVSVMGEKTQQQ